MQLLALVGSLRAKSYNRAVFNAYRELVGDKAEIVEGRFDDFPLFNQDVQDRGFPAPVERLAAQVQKADGILFFSPEYNYSVPGVLKNALDWLSRVPSKPLAGKSAAIVGASMGRIGTARMQYHLRQIGVFLDLCFMNQPEVMVAQAQQLIDDSGAVHDETTLRVLRKHYDAFAHFVAKRQNETLPETH